MNGNRDSESCRRADIDFLREVLHSGALLEREHFPLAERILRSFLAENGADARTLVLLNGLPRHVDQAEAVDAILHVEAVVSLCCSGETALERIRTDVGGDRSGRADDDLESVRRKLALFSERTAPLLDHYRALGAAVTTINVTAAMTAEDMWAILDAAS